MGQLDKEAAELREQNNALSRKLERLEEVAAGDYANKVCVCVWWGGWGGTVQPREVVVCSSYLVVVSCRVLGWWILMPCAPPPPPAGRHVRSLRCCPSV